MNKTATVILARGGSKRIPKKNIMPFKGKPLIEWTIIDALELGFPVWVFTDMPEIYEICKNYPDVNVRPKQLENEEGLHCTAAELKLYNEEMKAEYFILLQATSPMRDVSLMKEWVQLFFYRQLDVGFAVYMMPVVLYYNDYGEPLNFFMAQRTYNGAPRTPIYRETGSFYIFKKKMLDASHILNTNSRGIFMDPYCIDIDNLEDFNENKVDS